MSWPFVPDSRREGPDDTFPFATERRGMDLMSPANHYRRGVDGFREGRAALGRNNQDIALPGSLRKLFVSCTPHASLHAAHRRNRVEITLANRSVHGVRRQGMPEEFACLFILPDKHIVFVHVQIAVAMRRNAWRIWTIATPRERS